MKRNILIGAVVLLLVVIAFFLNTDKEKKEASPPPENPAQIDQSVADEPVSKTKSEPIEEGATAIDFELETRTGDTLRLYNNDGKPTLINFWASWCPPCKKEMPDLQKAYEIYGDKVNFFMVDLTFNDNLEKMNEYIEENGFTFPVLLDKTGDVTMDYQVMVIPTTYFVDADNVITHKVMGPMTTEQIESIMNEITNG